MNTKFCTLGFLAMGLAGLNAFAGPERIGRPYLECLSATQPVTEVEIFQRPVRDSSESEFLMSVDYHRGAQIPELSNVGMSRDDKAQENMGLQSYFCTEKFKGSNGLHFSLAISKKLKRLGYEAVLTQYSQTGAELVKQKVFCSYYVAFGFNEGPVPAGRSFEPSY